MSEYDFSQYSFSVKMEGSGDEAALSIKGTEKAPGADVKISKVVKDLIGAVGNQKFQQQSPNAQKLGKYTEALAKQIVETFDRIVSDEQAALFRELPQTSSQALEIEKKMLHELVLRHDPHDIKLLGSLLANLPKEVLETEPYVQAKEKYLEYFQTLALSEKPEDQAAFKLHFKEASQIDPYLFTAISSIIGDEKLSDETIRLLFSCIDEELRNDPESAALQWLNENFVLPTKQALESVPAESLSTKDAFLLTAFLWGLVANEVMLRSLSAAMQEVKDDAGFKDKMQEFETKLIEFTTKKACTCDLNDESEKRLFKTALEGLLVIASDTKWFESFLLRPDLTNEIGFNLILALGEILQENGSFPKGQENVHLILKRIVEIAKRQDTEPETEPVVTVHELRLAYFETGGQLDERAIILIGNSIAESGPPIYEKEEQDAWLKKLFQSIEKTASQKPFPQSVELLAKLAQPLHRLESETVNELQSALRERLVLHELSLLRDERNTPLLDKYAQYQLAVLERGGQRSAEIFSKAGAVLEKLPPEAFQKNRLLASIRETYFENVEELVRKGRVYSDEYIKQAIKLDPEGTMLYRLLRNVILKSPYSRPEWLLIKNFREAIDAVKAKGELPESLKALDKLLQLVEQEKAQFQWKEVYAQYFKAQTHEILLNNDFQAMDKLLKGGLQDDQIALLREVLTVVGESDKPLVKTMKDVFDRFKQIKSTPSGEKPEEEPLSNSEIFSFAYFIERDVVQVADIAKGLIGEQARYIPRKKSGLKHAVAITAHEVTIYSKEILGEGLIKTFVDCIVIPLQNRKAVPEIEAVGFTEKTKNLPEENFAETVREINLLRFFKEAKVEQIVEIRSFCGHKGTLDLSLQGSSAAQRLSVRFKKLQSGDDPKALEKLKLTTHQKASLVRDYILGLKKMHEMGYFHGDPKPGNLFVQTKGKRAGFPDGKIGDLGRTVQIKEDGGFPQDEHGVLLLGLHNTPFFTAPEHLFVKDFQGDKPKLEVFSLGLSCLAMFVNDEFLPLEKELKKIIGPIIAKLGEGKVLTDKEKEKYQTAHTKCIQDYIGPKHAALVQKQKELEKGKGKLSADDELKLLIYSMMLTDPKQRYSWDQADQASKKILKSFGAF